MKRLWIADVHANFPAFEAVLAAAGAVEEVVFLGDIVGFGPHPAACLARLMELRPRAVRGNHDDAVLGARRKNAPAFNWDHWSRERLSPAQLDFLAALPASLSIGSTCGEITALHHPPGAAYLHPDMPDAVLGEQFRDVPGAMIVCGHSHRGIDRCVNGRRVVCLPAIGQPRNGDPRAGYAIEENGELSFHFVAYDVERTARDIQYLGLDEAFRRRWLRFLRTGYDVDWSRDYRP